MNGSMVNNTSQWQDPEIFVFVIKVHYEKLGHMLKPLMPKFRSDLSVRLRDTAEKQVHAKLKPIVGVLGVSPSSNFPVASVVGLTICRGRPRPEVASDAEDHRSVAR